MKRFYAALLALLCLLPVTAWAGNFNQSTCCLHPDYTSTNGFLWFSDGTDVSDYTTGVTGAYKGWVEDSSGNKAYFDAGSAGSGVSTAPELLDDPGFDGGGWDSVAANWTIAGSVATSDGNSGFLRDDNKTQTQYGSYVGRLTVTVYNSGAVAIPYNGTADGKYFSSAGSHEHYFVAASGAPYPRHGFIHSNSFNGTVDDAQYRRILTPGSTGLYVEWGSIDAGFDYNDASGYTVKIWKTDDGGPRSRINRRVNPRTR